MDSMTDIDVALRLARISDELVARPDHPDAGHYDATARSIASKAVDFVPGCEMAAVVRRERSKLALVAATNEHAAACVRLELGLDGGPTVTAAWHSDVSVVESVASDVRWPDWTRDAQGHGIASALALRLAVGQELLGVLTVLSSRPHTWSSRELSLGAAFATHASTASHIAKLSDMVQHTAEARHRIGIAQGILMHRYGVTKEAAFSLLQRYSNATNTKVRDLAVDVYERGDLPPSRMVATPQRHRPSA